MANKQPRRVEEDIVVDRLALETPQQQPLPHPSRSSPPPAAVASAQQQRLPKNQMQDIWGGLRRHSEQPPPGNLLTPSGAGKTGRMQQARSLSVVASDTPLLTTLERLLAILEKKRRRDGRPENLNEMTAVQVTAEKKALQKALLQFQRRHGRPHNKQDKEAVRSLYERYRLVKQLIGKEEFRNTDEEDSITSPEESPPTLTSSSHAEPTAPCSPSLLTEDAELSSHPRFIAGAKTSKVGMLAKEPVGKIIKTGNLLKSSSSHMGIHMGERRFRLTEEALEYFQHFSHEKVRRSFPLTSIEKIEYDPDNKEPGPKVFKLFFSTYVMTLRAETREDAKDWVEKIENAWKMWQLLPGSKHSRKPRFGPRDSSLSLPLFTPTEPAEETIEEEEEEKSGGEEQVTVPLPLAATTPLQEEDKPKSKGRGGSILIHRRSRTCVSDPRQESFMDEGIHERKRRRGTKFWRAVKLAPILANHFHHARTLHQDYPMIKYPRRKWALPSEKLVKIDDDNLQIMWRRNQASSFKYSKSLSLYRILEIREGQQTAKFDEFPYDEVWDQSFSLIFEGVKKGGKYIGLTALDLICDSIDSCKEWSQGLKSLVSGFQASSFPFQHNNTDPTILWMKQLWSCHSIDHEITERTAIKLARRFKPTITRQEAKTRVEEAHAHQYRHTHNLGNSLRWDGFVAVFSLLCGMTGRMFRLFRKYAKKHPRLGMAPKEFKAFLVSECHWDCNLCTDDEVQKLIYHHDYHHRAFKKYVAQNKPSDFQTVAKLLSYAGFLSFLRSKDNSAVNVEHNSVYQDMTQPMSHYFINSSHNTYLEEDQLYGHSSTDAYVRTLVQGCRCVEIDCWDDTFRVTGLDEPIIYHGYTLTTKLPFRDVIQTIKDYAFNFSNYPVIISIENHCSRNQQVKMAKLFKKVMGDVLVLEYLVESQGRDRLPSPQELQGKILLKGSYRQLRGSPKRQRQVSRHTMAVSQTSLKSPHNRYNSVASDTESDVDEHMMASQDMDLEGSVVALSLKFDSEDVHGIDRKQVKEWARLAEQDDKSVVFKEDDQELVFATVPELQCLIPYCRAVSIKPWDWEKQLHNTTISEMFSFGEVSANKHCDNSPREMLACSEQQLVRTYPKGVRFDSSNYDPIPMWNCGIHMVALNWQYPDIFMHLNQGLFRRNGGCGYILKPEVMRRPDPAGDPTPYLPTMTEPHPDVTPVDLEIELLSGQRLCFWKKKCSTLTVEIHTYGIPRDTDKMQPPATAQDNDTFWPQWKERLHVYQKKILMPELCLVYFRVDVVLKGPGLGAKSQLYGQNCISLVSLMPGIKFIPLRTPGGELIPESGLFVQIKKKSSPSHQDSVTEQVNSSTEQYFGDVSVTESIHPSLLRERQTVANHSDDDDDDVDITPLDYLRRQSCPADVGVHFETDVSWKSQLDELIHESRSSGREKQLDVIAEIHGGEDESASAAANKVVVTVSPKPQGSFEAAGGEEGVITMPFDLDISTTDTESDII